MVVDDAPAGARARRPPTDEPASLANVPPDLTVRAAAPLAAAFGGRVPRAGVILVSGEPKAGKSTQCARLLLELARRGWSALILDAEMTASRARDVLVRAGADDRELATVRRVDLRGAELPAVMRALARHRPRVAIVDSLHACTSPGERGTAMQALTNAATGLVLVVAHSNAQGRAHGGNALDHGCDGVAIVKRDGVIATGCRWADV